MSTASVARVEVADYLALEATAETKHEFVNGEIVAMAGATLEHEAVKVGLSTALVAALAKAGRPCITLGSDTRVRIDETGLYGYPDATVVCGRPDLDRTHAPPTLLNPQVVFEVLSPSTEAYDRGAKAGHYRQRASLMEYVLVSSTERSVEVLRRDEGGWWKTGIFTGDGRVPLASLGIELALDDIYGQLEALRAAEAEGAAEG
ncbi:MAG: Uma2 family endonuclease [Myxococcales bacterium]|nr:Uma2 family endonuclease [Myxococcales bacterium]